MIYRALSAVFAALAFFMCLMAIGYALGYADAATASQKDLPLCRAQTFPEPFKGTLP